jgi:hypothetical protein
MRLAFEILDDVNNVNSFKEVSEYVMVSGNPDILYVRLINLAQPLDPSNTSLYNRYIPGVGATVTANFTSIDDSKSISRAATNPFPGDTSIFSIPILATDSIMPDSLELTLVDGASTYTLELKGTLSVAPTGTGKYFC